MSDNYHFKLVSMGRKHFDVAMSLAFAVHSTAVGYKIDEKNRMVLFWADHNADKGYQKLPYPMSVGAASEFVWHWLTSASKYGPEPDHDGDNDKGFAVYNESWGHVGGNWQGFVAIEPAWMMYGK